MGILERFLRLDTSEDCLALKTRLMISSVVCLVFLFCRFFWFIQAESLFLSSPFSNNISFIQKKKNEW